LELLTQARVCDLCDDGESTVVDCGSMVHVLPAALAHLHETYHAQTATFTLLIKNATAAEIAPVIKEFVAIFVNVRRAFSVSREEKALTVCLSRCTGLTQYTT